MANPAPAKRQKQDDWFGYALNELARRAPQALSLMTPAGRAMALQALLADRRKQPPTTAPAKSAKPSPAPREPAATSSGSPVDRFIYQQLTRRDPVAKAVAGYGAREFGRPVGLVLGGVDALDSVVDAGAFALRFNSPLDQVLTGTGISAHDQMLAFVAQTEDALVHPRRSGERAVKALRQFWEDHDPAATPQAENAAGEIGRNFRIGVNQGELQFNLLAMARGGPTMRGLGRRAPMTEGEWLAEGIPPTKAKVFAEPYVQKGLRREGHHSPVGKKSDLGKLLPKKILDLPINVVTYEGQSTGEALRHHYGTDKFVHGGQIGGVRWSGKDLGWLKYGLADRLWYGTPEATKDIIAGALLGSVLLKDAPAIPREAHE